MNGSRRAVCLLELTLWSWHPATPSSSGLTFDGFKADIWSVGVVAFELLTGHTPFPVGQNGLMTAEEHEDYLQLSFELRQEQLMASYLEW